MDDIREEVVNIDSMEMMPIFITMLEIIEPEDRDANLLDKFKTGGLYKAYKNEEGYFLFPSQDSNKAFCFHSLDEDTIYYKVKLMVVTTDNFQEIIDDLSEGDIQYLSEILERDITDEIDKEAYKEVREQVSYEDDKDKFKVTEAEVKALFDVFNTVDPKMARSLLEFGKYALIMAQRQEGLDKMVYEIHKDSDLGKGAYTSNTVKEVVKYAKDKDGQGFGSVLKTGFYTLIEIARCLR